MLICVKLDRNRIYTLQGVNAAAVRLKYIGAVMMNVVHLFHVVRVVVLRVQPWHRGGDDARDD